MIQILAKILNSYGFALRVGRNITEIQRIIQMTNSCEISKDCCIVGIDFCIITYLNWIPHEDNSCFHFFTPMLSPAFRSILVWAEGRCKPN